MRALLVALIVLLSPAISGCLDRGAPPDSAPANATNSTANATAPMAKILLNQSHSFTTGAAADTPAGGNTTSPVTIPPGYSKLNLTVRFSPSSGAPVPAPAPVGAASGVSVKLGNLTCDVPDGPFTTAFTCTKEGPATAGDAKVEYLGEGSVRARVTVTAT